MYFLCKGRLKALLLLSGFLFLGGCSPSQAMNSISSSQTTQEARATWITIEDDLERMVSFEVPERVAILIGSFTDLFLEAGGQEQLVAAAHDSWTSFDLNLEGVADLGDVKAIAQETLVAAKPDLIIASAKNESQKRMKEMFDALEIPVVYFDVSSFEDYLETLERMVKITQHEEAYAQYGLAQQAQIQAIQNKPRLTTPKVLALRETGKGVSALDPESSLLGQMLNDLQVQNMAPKSGLSTLSMEVIQVEDPDIILYVAQGKDLKTAQEMANRLFSDPTWQSLRAIQEGRVYVLDQRLYNLKPNSNWAKALADLEVLIYGQ